MHVNRLLLFGLNWSIGSSSLHAWQYRSFSTIFPFDSTYNESDVTTEGFAEELTHTAKLQAVVGSVILTIHNTRLKYHLSEFFVAHGVSSDFYLVTSSKNKNSTPSDVITTFDYGVTRFLAYSLQHHYHYLIYFGDSQYTPNAPFEQIY